MPDITFDKLELIPDGLREHATAKDGKFVVNVVPNSKLVEFRDNNIVLSQERDLLKAKVGTYTGIIGEDVEKAKTELAALRDLDKQVKDGKLSANKDQAAAIQAAREEAARTLQAAIDEAKAEAATQRAEKAALQTEVKRDKVRAAVQLAVLAADSPVNSAALADILARADNVFALADDGKVVAQSAGKVIYSQRDGTTPLQPAEWLASLVKEAPYLGKISSGGGAAGETGQRILGVDNDQFKKLSPTARLDAYRRAQAGK